MDIKHQSALEMVPVRTKREAEDFIELPFHLYKNDPNWIPPLRKELEKVFHRKYNPFLQHAEIERFLCKDTGRTVGRIACIIDENHNRFHKEKTAFFGFFEAINDNKVAGLLFDSAVAWGRERGMERLRGPVNPSMNAECAFLLEGFDMPPVLMMPYNPPYYLSLAEAYGFGKAKDLYAFRKASSVGTPECFEKLVRLVRRRTKVVVRPFEMKHFDRDMEHIKRIYNTAWEKNWGFVPMTDAEMDQIAKMLKPLAVPELILFAEIEGKPVAVSVNAPDYNQILEHLSGSLGLMGLAKFAYYRRKVTGLRALIFGVLKEYRKAGLHAVLYYEAEKAAQRLGYHWCELSWNLEDNYEINSFDASLGAEIYKKYRIYEIDL
jgi:GNAT superfamily N-acetyltransferase